MSRTHPQVPAICYLELLTNESSINEAVQVLGEAFGWQFFYSGCDKSKDLVYASLLCYTKAAFLDGEVWVAKAHEDHRIIGVAVWFGPGQKFIKKFGAGSYHDHSADLSSVMNKKNAVGGIYFSADCPTRLANGGHIYDKGVDAILGTDVRLNNWHLQLLGVHPNYQRKGVGTSLCEYIEAKARTQGVLTVLEAPDPKKSKEVYQEKMQYEWKGATELIKSPEGIPSVSFNVLTKA
ncbi:hypothetical protein DL96DRAFT_1821881 [Flagelloscypha sp. PMI_526]|nr:hypothetical protein DL96DRAFT_1821881 [Flagelloscypha sp. PMI_526]